MMSTADKARTRHRGTVLATLLTISLGACGVSDSGGNPIATASIQASAIAGLESPVTEGNRASYDFATFATQYLRIIGTRFPDRSVTSAKGKGHDEFVEWLLSELTSWGYPSAWIEEQEFSLQGASGEVVRGRNIVLTVPGQAESGSMVVGAHYDGNGVGDNASGVALLLASAKGLAGRPPAMTVRYVFFDAEEEGMLGSRHYVDAMTESERDDTILMVNVDAVAFGDHCCLAGGTFGSDYGNLGFVPSSEGPDAEVDATDAYDLATRLARDMGFRIYGTADLDGYHAEHGTGMDVEDGAFFTNPWTLRHPAPENMMVPSPVALPVSDHVPFAQAGIPYVTFEATNWWARGTDGMSPYAYTGYVETANERAGDGGRFMNTGHDTLEDLDELFPSRAESHYHMFSPLLSALVLAQPSGYHRVAEPLESA